MNSKLFILIFMIILLIGQVSAFELNPFATKKMVDEVTIVDKNDFMLQELSDYPTIKLSKTLFWIETDRIAEYKIVENSCGFTNCRMNIKVRTYSDEVLFDDEMKYLDMIRGGETLLNTQYYLRGEDQTYSIDVNDYKYTNCRNVYDNITEITSQKCDETFLGTHQEERIRETWTQYNQEVLPSGEYEIELRGKIEVGQSVDVIPYAQNKEFSEWAVWTSALNVDLMTYLSFDDNSGLTANNSLTPLLFNGTIGNAIQWNSTNKKLGDSAIQIKDEVDRMAHINDNVILDSTDGFSFNTWAYRFDGSADNKVLGQETGGLFFGYDATNVLGVSIRGVGTVSTSANTSIRVWEMISLIVSSGNYSIYRNGVIEATGNIAAYSGSGFVRIGNIDNSDSTVSMFKGTLDEMAFWNRTLTDQEVLDLWNDGDALPFVPDIALTATLSSPVDDFSTVDTTPDLSCNFTSSGSVNIANVTIEVYDSSNNLDYTDTDTTPGGTTKSFNKTWTTTSLSLDTYNWSCSTFGDDSSNATTSNRTINIVVPTVTLNSPANDFEAPMINNEFNISANLFDSSTIKNMSLFTNKSGVFEATEILIFSSFGLEKENLTEVVSTSTGFELVKNITYNNYTLNVTNDIGSSSAISHTISSTTRYVYEDSTFLDVNFSKVSSSATFTFVEYINPSPNKKVNNIEIYIKTSSGSNDVREKNTKIFGNQVSSSTEIFNTIITGATLWTGQVCSVNDVCIFSNENRTIIVDDTPPIINIISPSGIIESIVIGNNLSLNWTVSDPNLDICWFDYNDINTTVICTDNNYSFITIQDKQSLTFYANDTFNNLGSNSTSWTYKFVENSQTYNNETIEGSIETFLANITIENSLTISSTLFIYDGSSNIAENFISGPNNILRMTNFVIPNVTAQQEFNFNFQITLSDSSVINLSTQTQTVSNISIDDCAVNSFELFNFTLIDEEDQDILLINTSIELAVNVLSIDRSITVASLSNNFNNTNPVLVCLNNITGDSSYVVDATVKYEAQDRVIEYYNIRNSTINNETTISNIFLFDLLTVDNTDFQLTFKGADFVAVEGALINLQRQYVSENIFKTVELPITDANGQTVVHLVRNDVVYNIVVSKDNTVLGTFNNIIAFCEDFTIGNCQINLNAFSSSEEVFDYNDALGISFTPIVYNETSRVASLNFLTVDGTTKTVNFTISKDDIFGNDTVCSSQVVSSGGTLTCIVPSFIDTSPLTAEVFVDGTQSIIDSIYLTTRNISTFGYFIMFLMILSITMMLLSSKTMTLIGLFVGVGSSMVLTLVEGKVVGSGSSLIWLAIVIIAMIWKLNKGRTE